MQTDNAQKVMERFYSTLDRLIAFQAVNSIYDFCKRYDIPRDHYYGQRSDRTKSKFKPYWLSYLVRDFGISGTWLLTGEGEMIRTGETWSQLVVRLQNSKKLWFLGGDF